MPPGLQSYLAPQGGLNQRFLAGQDISGIVMLSGAPMLVSSQPLFAMESKTVEGSIVIGRWMDAAVIAELGATTRLDLSLASTGATDLPQQVKDAVTAAGTAATTAAGTSGRRAGHPGHGPQHVRPPQRR